MENNDPTEQLNLKFGERTFIKQATKDDILTLWLPLGRIIEVLKYLKTEISHPFPFLFDLTAIDERSRKKDIDYPPSQFTLVYHLFSFDRNNFLRIKVALMEDYPAAPSITKLWANASWYEREVYDMFGIRFEGHPHLTRILMPLTWDGHPLRKEHPARATEMGPFRLWDEKQDREQSALQFRPEEWGMELQSE
ncbi:MAG TPA: NADH-quinone oxidoreductase subunit C, partial [Chryseolinea sp.]|nr:NADH-quinone oxidoreductase subunit C [Chryseolinea sp.]